MQTSDTICATATPSGGAIGIIRLSGPRAIEIADALFTPANHEPLHKKKGGTVSFGRITTPGQKEPIDEVLASLFRAPHSYTGEDCVEFSCHGSRYVMSRILQLLIARGCRMARPGEYTQRAFLNGKMDLSQAEAVADLIASDTAASHRMAMNQMRGCFGKELRQLRERLLHLTSLLELELDFSDHEELEFADRTELTRLAHDIQNHIDTLRRSFSLGNVLKNGLPVAIVGSPNAGKSTLLNALVGEERAIVSQQQGTTRDTIEETIRLGDIAVRFIDTAGLRHATDDVERIGISKSYEKMLHAEIVLWLIDSTNARKQFDTLSTEILKTCQDKQLFLLLTKSDLATPAVIHETIENLHSCRPNVPFSSIAADAYHLPAPSDLKKRIPLLFPFSTHQTSDLAFLKSLIEAFVQAQTETAASPTDTIVSNARHYESLCLAGEAIARALTGLRTQLSGDLVSQDLRECITHLSAITGDEITTDEVLQNIFKHFCVGK